MKVSVHFDKLYIGQLAKENQKQKHFAFSLWSTRMAAKAHAAKPAITFSWRLFKFLPLEI